MLGGRSAAMAGRRRTTLDGGRIDLQGVAVSSGLFRLAPAGLAGVGSGSPPRRTLHLRQQTRRHDGQTADLHTRLDRRRGPALRRLFLASVFVATIACGTVGHRPGLLDGGTVGGALLRLAMDDTGHGWAETAHALLRTEDGGRSWLAVPLPTAVDLSREPLTAFTGRAGAWLCEQGAARGSSPMRRNPEGDPRNR